MSEDTRKVVHAKERMTITEEELETAFQGCEEVFWAKALEYFPEVKTGDTEPAITIHHSTIVKGFMEHWLENAPIMVEGINEEQAESLAEHVIDAGFNFAGDDGDFLIATEGSPDPMTVLVVEIRHEGKPQGFAVQVGDVVGETTKLARTQAELEYAIADTTKAIKDRIGK